MEDRAYVLVFSDVDYGIEVQLYRNKDDAIAQFKSIVDGYDDYEQDDSYCYVSDNILLYIEDLKIR